MPEQNDAEQSGLVDGATKREGGLSWVYREPPGTWLVQGAVGPLYRPVNLVIEDTPDAEE